MMGFLQWLSSFNFPKDPHFKWRAHGSERGRYLVTELSGHDQVVLVDTLEKIRSSGESESDQSRLMLGLRYQALAMSLRTRNGRIPFDYKAEKDLSALAHYPQSVVILALDELAELSDVPWLSPTLMTMSVSERVDVAEADRAGEVEDTHENP